MCVQSPCENCLSGYDACYEACPKCGHPNKEGGLIIELPRFTEKEVWCQICEKNHTVKVYEGAK